MYGYVFDVIYRCSTAGVFTLLQSRSFLLLAHNVSYQLSGGASVNKWLLKLHREQNITYFTHWGRSPAARTSFAEKMEQQLNNTLGPSEWRFAHAHGYSLLPYEDGANLDKWRDTVESQGCQFIVATLLRDALGHTISQVKEKHHVELKAAQNGTLLNLTFAEWVSPPRAWSTQLDYFLFNSWAREMNPNYTREEKVRMAVEILRKHYDLVAYNNHELFRTTVLKMLGLNVNSYQIRRTNVYKGDITFTMREFSLLKNVTYENGDTDWIDVVKHVYGRELDYLGN